MYTVEFESDASVVTTLDDNSKFEDVELVIAEDGTVYLRQFDEAMQEHQIIYMSYQQMMDLMASLQSPEGAFRLHMQNK